MKQGVTITGKVVSGVRKAAHFTSLDWVEAQCCSKLGFIPYPGTLNLELSPRSLRSLEVILKGSVLELVSPDSSSCSAGIIPVSLGPCRGALVMISEDARIHAGNIVEIIAPVKIRDALGLEDGAEVTFFADAVLPSGTLLFRLGDDFIPIRAVLFDLDGTLLDTKEIYYSIMDTVFERLCVPCVSREMLVAASAEGEFDWEMVLPDRFRGMTREFLPEIGSIIEEISPPLFKERNALIPGADSLLRRLAAQRVKLGVVTSTKARQMTLKLLPLRESGLESLFDAIITADDLPRQKPSPDPLFECARRLGVLPGECLYVGDMRVDIRAGKSAGMITAGVLTGFDLSPTLQAEGADLILDSVAELEFLNSEHLEIDT